MVQLNPLKWKKKKQKKENLFIRGGKKIAETAGDIKAGSGTILNVYKRALTTSPRQNILRAERELDQHKANKLKKKGRHYTKGQNEALIKKVRGESIDQIHARNRNQATDYVKRLNKDWEKMRKGKMSKEDFMRKYPNSGTTRAHTARMDPVTKRKFLKSLKKKKKLGTRLANMLDNK